MRICFFDIDGTLIASGGAGQKAFAHVFRTLFGVDELTSEVSFAGRSDRAIALDLLAAHGAEPSEENWHRFRNAYVAQLPASLATCQGAVLPGVQLLIEQLTSYGGVDIGLLTGNVVRGAEAKLTYYGLWHHFEFGGFGDLHTSRDEIARSAVEAASQHLNLMPNGNSRFAVVGDTVHDITCARAIGAYSVVVPTGLTPIDELRAAQPDLAIETLEDAQPLIEWLTA